MSERDAVFEYLQKRIITHYPAAQDILDGVMPAPRTAIVYPTYVCNQNCLWCEYAADNTEYHTIMPEDKLRKLVLEDLKNLGVRGVEFCGGGEPTLHTALPQLIRDMKAQKMSIGLLTNGTRLKGELAEAIVDCGSYVRIGFDSARAATFDKVKRPKGKDAGFDAVCENVKAVTDLRRERGSWLMISIKVMLSAENYLEVEDCVRLAIKLGVDSVQFKAARLCDTELNETQCESVRNQMKRAREHYPEMLVVGGPDKINIDQQCWLTPIQVTVDTLGDVFLCCYYRHRRDSHCIGNVFETPLHDIWYSQRHWDVIKGIKPAECNLLDCRFVNYNKIMTELLINRDAQFEFI